MHEESLLFNTVKFNVYKSLPSLQCNSRMTAVTAFASKTCSKYSLEGCDLFHQIKIPA